MYTWFSAKMSWMDGQSLVLPYKYTFLKPNLYYLSRIKKEKKNRLGHNCNAGLFFRVRQAVHKPHFPPYYL